MRRLKIKKFGITLLVLVALLMPSNAFAATGWQLKGTEYIAIPSNGNVLTDVYTATDGGNFKLEITGAADSNSVGAAMYVNGVWRDTKATGFNSSGKAVIEFSDLSSGNKVQFDLTLIDHDVVTVKFYD